MRLTIVMITWGPDGLTGHPDHRMASNLATEVFQQRARLNHRPRKLYYVAWPESKFLNPPPPFDRRPAGTVADVFVTTEVDGNAYLEPARKALQCHKTQYQPAQMEAMFHLTTKAQEGKVFLRLALTDLPRPSGRERDILEGIQ